MLTPKTRDDDEQRRARVRPQRPAREHQPGEQRAHGRGAAQQAEADRARVEDRLREHRRERDRAAEQHGEEVERDRAEQDRRAADEVDARRARVSKLGASFVGSRAGSWINRMQTRPIVSSSGRDAVDELGRDRRTAARRSPARRSSRPGTRSSAAPSRSRSGRTARPSPAAPARAARDRVGAADRDREHEERPELRRRRSATRRAAAARRAIVTAVAPANSSRREKRSARCPAGSASSGSGANSASPIRPRSSGEWRISKTCQPTATAAICAPSPSTSSAAQSRRVVAAPERGRQPLEPTPAPPPGVGLHRGRVWRSGRRRGPASRRQSSLAGLAARRLSDDVGAAVLVVGEHAVERAPRLGQQLRPPRRPAPRCRRA